MSYLGLDLDSLVWEIKALMKNKNGKLTDDNKEELFYLAKTDILETFRDIIDDNFEEVIDELEGEKEI